MAFSEDGDPTRASQIMFWNSRRSAPIAGVTFSKTRSLNRSKANNQVVRTFLFDRFAAAAFDYLLRERAVKAAIFLLAAAGIDFLTCKRADQTGFRRWTA